MERTQPVMMQVYCRVEVVVHDPEAVTDLAARELREADIDWSKEEDDMESAVAELKANLRQSLASFANPHNLLDGVPGVEVRAGFVWAEQGEGHPRFRPGFGDTP
ncbi:hypothetical protein [Phytohabitans aurantiacus]|uniref:Uncharacterized protein n=1 Tax=Phytohabitans aurantiacus TaxID=3016789 RepID=A0ABQ5QMZ2_9ACTN|nr:hypothetical protein [Phytohabitans aurantiacus]GLH96056.1 hypothetical protein Pa4123_13290 [Phytohabitans aurantiacus]